MKKIIQISVISILFGLLIYKTFMLEGEAMPPFTLTSTAFSSGMVIPREYTCDGANISPELIWEHAPKNTKSFVLIVDDPDAKAVAGKIYVHWIVANIPPELTRLSRGASLMNVGHAQELTNDFGRTTYGGPCPPDREHTYRFTIFALNQPLEAIRMSAPFNADIFRMEYSKEILGEALLTGRYTKL